MKDEHIRFAFFLQDGAGRDRKSILLLCTAKDGYHGVHAGKMCIRDSSKGIIPRIVVSEAIMTGRRRLWELSISAVIGSTPSLI